jgi:hypothetical protein
MHVFPPGKRPGLAMRERWGAKKTPAIVGRRLKMESAPCLYSGAGVAFGFFSTFFFGEGVVGAGGMPGLA